MSALALSGGPRAKPSIAVSSASAIRDRTQRRGNGMDKSFGTSFEKLFAERFGHFLRQNFANPTQVAAAFGVRERTAENWWNGLNAPSGWQVAKVFLCWPDEAREALGQECEGKSRNAGGGSRSSSQRPSDRNGSQRKQRAA